MINESEFWAAHRFKYSKAFLQWALRGPGFVADWHVGVRVAATRKLARPGTLYPKIPIRRFENSRHCPVPQRMLPGQA